MHVDYLPNSVARDPFLYPRYYGRVMVFGIKLSYISKARCTRPRLPACWTRREVAQPRYQATMETTWQIQLQGATNTGYQADLYILDLFDTPQSVITDLQASGRKVICYFSAGTYEEWREDEGRFTAADKGGQLDNWPGERWLNTRSTNVRSIMVDRLTLAAEKGCDGVDPRQR